MQPVARDRLGLALEADGHVDPSGSGVRRSRRSGSQPSQPSAVQLVLDSGLGCLTTGYPAPSTATSVRVCGVWSAASWASYASRACAASCGRAVSGDPRVLAVDQHVVRRSGAGMNSTPGQASPASSPEPVPGRAGRGGQDDRLRPPRPRPPARSGAAAAYALGQQLRPPSSPSPRYRKNTAAGSVRSSRASRNSRALAVSRSRNAPALLRLQADVDQPAELLGHVLLEVLVERQDVLRRRARRGTGRPRRPASGTPSGRIIRPGPAPAVAGGRGRRATGPSRPAGSGRS